MLPKGLASTPFGNSEGDLGLISGRQSEIVLPLAANSPTNRSFETISLALSCYHQCIPQQSRLAVFYYNEPRSIRMCRQSHACAARLKNNGVTIEGLAGLFDFGGAQNGGVEAGSRVS
jgi:hypothetical protein